MHFVVKTARKLQRVVNMHDEVQLLCKVAKNMSDHKIVTQMIGPVYTSG